MQELTYIKDKCFKNWTGFNVIILNPKYIKILGDLCLDADPSMIERRIFELLYNAPELSQKQVDFMERYERAHSRNFTFRGKIVEKNIYVQVDMNNL